MDFVIHDINPVEYFDFVAVNITAEDKAVISKIKSFRNLPDGWNFGEGSPPSDRIIQKAVSVYKFGISHGFKGSARPDPAGGVILGFSAMDNFVYVSINSDDTIGLVYEKGFGQTYEILDEKEGVSLNYLSNKLTKINPRWSSSGHYTLVTTTKTVVVSQVILLRDTETVSQSFWKNAREHLVTDQFVNTLEPIIPALQVTQ